DGARPLSDLGRADEPDDLAVRLQAHDRRRDRMCARREQADRDPAADRRGLRLRPADCGGGLLDVADEIGVERLGAATQLLARTAEILAPDVKGIATRLSGQLVDLRLADPLKVCRAERP